MPLDVEENTTANLDRMLKAGELDAVILALPYDGPGIETVPLYEEMFRVVAPARHALARRKSVAVEELDAGELLLLPVGHCFRDQVLDACHEFSRPPEAGRQGNSLETLRSMVASGLGVSGAAGDRAHAAPRQRAGEGGRILQRPARCGASRSPRAAASTAPRRWRSWSPRSAACTCR